jgi:radical SAM superfamily enzyme YgiQ (UPF0313 family)
MVRALLIHPWIYDFAAHDYWLKPLGLLRLAGFLRSAGIWVDFIDCLDPYHSSMAGKGIHRGAYGKGKLYKEEIPKPPIISWFPRKYSRYGMPFAVFDSELARLPRPDVILVTTGMTYWYPGVQETIKHCRDIFQDVPVVLGGIYATLCQDHAEAFSGADRVIPGNNWFRIVQGLMSYMPSLPPPGTKERFPAWDLAPRSDSIVVRTSEGCPFRCSYCASRIMSPFRMRVPEKVVHEIVEALRSTQANDVAFYDDALLWEPENGLTVILDRLDRLGLYPRYHCPNGLHARFITPAVARMLHRSQFTTIRLGLESAHRIFHERNGQKVYPDEFRRAVNALHSAGYTANQIGAYVMVGLPGQPLQEVEDSIRFVLSVGATPYLAEYSPIPGTSLWAEAVKRSPYPLEEEPLFHNNTLLPCLDADMHYEDVLEIKSSLQRQRNKMAER